MNHSNQENLPIHNQSIHNQPIHNQSDLQINQTQNSYHQTSNTSSSNFTTIMNNETVSNHLSNPQNLLINSSNQHPIDSWNLDSGIQTRLPNSEESSCASEPIIKKHPLNHVLIDEIETFNNLSHNTNLDSMSNMSNVNLIDNSQHSNYDQVFVESNFNNLNDDIKNLQITTKCPETNLDSTLASTNQFSNTEINQSQFNLNSNISSLINENLNSNSNENAFSPKMVYSPQPNQINCNNFITNQNFSQNLNLSQNNQILNRIEITDFDRLEQSQLINVSNNSDYSYIEHKNGQSTRKLTKLINNRLRTTYTYSNRSNNQSINNFNPINENSSMNQSSAHHQKISAVNQLIEALMDNDNVVVVNALRTVYRTSKDEKSRGYLINSFHLVRQLIHLASNTYDIKDTLYYISGIFMNFTLTTRGLRNLFQNNIIPVIYKLLSVDSIRNQDSEKVVCFAITALHNLISKQEGVVNAIQEMRDGISTIIQFLNRNDNKFLAIIVDCLHCIAFKNQDAKRTILENLGTEKLIKILDKPHDYAKLSWMTIRLIKVLSICPLNKLAIIESNGIQVLGKYLFYSEKKILMNTLWSIRNLSDAANQCNNLDDIIQKLIFLMSNSDNYELLTTCMGILRNLTWNNGHNKQLIFKENGFEMLLQLFRKADREEILEEILCTLSHMTSRHDYSEDCQNLIRTTGNLELIVQLLSSSSNSTIKQCISLIRNLTICEDNIIPLRELNAVQKIFDLLDKAHQKVTRNRICSTSEQKDFDIYKKINYCDETRLIINLIENSLFALLLMTRDKKCCEQMIELPLIHDCFEIILYPLENIQKAAICCLDELSKIPEGLDKIALEDYFILESLKNSPNEQISTTAASVYSEVIKLEIPFQSFL